MLVSWCPVWWHLELIYNPTSKPVIHLILRHLEGRIFQWYKSVLPLVTRSNPTWTPVPIENITPSLLATRHRQIEMEASERARRKATQTNVGFRVIFASEVIFMFCLQPWMNHQLTGCCRSYLYRIFPWFTESIHLQKGRLIDWLIEQSFSPTGPERWVRNVPVTLTTSH